MPVRIAQKLERSDEQPLRGFVDLDAKPPQEYVYLKDAFELGAHSQLFVGARRALDADTWHKRIFKRVSALPSKTEGGVRHTLALERAALDADLGLRPNRKPWQDQGTMSARAIRQEVAAVQACPAPFARDTEILATPRAGNRVPGKYFYVMPPAPTDLLGCVHALESELPELRRAVALTVLQHVGRQLHDMHTRQGRAHCDVRSENILGVVDVQQHPGVLLWDFGLALSAEEVDIGPAKRADMLGLGKVFAMVLAPDCRPHLEGKNLAVTRHALAQRHPEMSAVLHGLLNPDGQARWDAVRLLQYLDEPCAWRRDDAVREFLARVTPLQEAIEEKWQTFVALVGEAPSDEDSADSESTRTGQ